MIDTLLDALHKRTAHGDAVLPVAANPSGMTWHY